MRAIQARYSTRLHMTLIVGTSIATALLITKLLYAVGVMAMWIRYPLALLAAYGVFFLGVWIWLQFSPYGRYLRAQQSSQGSLDGGDIDLGFGINPAGLRSGVPTPSFSGGGGVFDGGGAAGAWQEAVSTPSLEITSDVSAGSASGGIGMPDISLDVDGEAGCLLIIAGILLVIVLSAVFGAAAYVIYQAPAILGEVVFEVMLGSSLVRGARAINSTSWGKALLAMTWKPFLLMTSAAMVFALYCAWAFPNVHSASEVIRLLATKYIV